jgi:hypothetical protein
MYCVRLYYCTAMKSVYTAVKSVYTAVLKSLKVSCRKVCKPAFSQQQTKQPSLRKQPACAQPRPSDDARPRFSVNTLAPAFPSSRTAAAP